MISTTEQLQSHLENFSEFTKHAAGRDLGWLRKFREDAFARFCEAGFPTTRDEDWRFTNVAAIAKSVFHLATKSGATPEKSALADQRIIPDSSCRLVFVNGHFAAELSSMGKLPTGVEVNSLALQIQKDPAAVERHLGRYLNIQRDAFSALNTAFAEDGAYIHIARGVVITDPIYLLFIWTPSDKPVITLPRNLIVVGYEAQATIVEDYVSIGETPAFSNTATELVAGENAV